MPEGVDGTGRWNYLPGGQRVWVEYKATKAPPPPSLDEAVKTLKKEAARRKAAPKPPSSRTPSTRTPSTPAPKPGMSQAQKRALAQTARRQQRQAAAEAERARLLAQMRARLKKRAAKVNKRLAADLKDIEKKRQAHLATATRLESEIAAAGSNVHHQMALRNQLRAENLALLKLEKQEMKAYGLKQRADGFDNLQAQVAVRNAQQAYSGAKLGTDPNPYRQEKPEGARAEYGFGGLVRDQYEHRYKTKPGQYGHHKSIRKALTTDLAMAAQHPEWFDTPEGAKAVNEGLFAHWEQLEEHAALIAAENNQRQLRLRNQNRKFIRQRRKYNKSKKESDYKKLVATAQKFKQMAEDPKAKRLIAEIDAVYGRTAVRPDFKVTKATQLGLMWFYEKGIDYVYSNVEERQLAIAAVEGNAGRAAALERDAAQMESDLRAAHQRLQPQVYDPVSGKMKDQTFEHWFRQVQRDGLPAEAMRLQAGAWEETVNVNVRMLETESDPVLSRFYKMLKDEGIETNEDLKFSANSAFADKAMGLAVNGAMAEWEASKEFQPPSRKPLMDETRYGVDERGEFYEMESGERIYRGDALPLDRFGRSHETPLWGKCSLSDNIANPGMCAVDDSYEEARREADYQYKRAQEKQYVSVISRETGREMRDVLAYEMTGSEGLSAAIAWATESVRHLEGAFGTVLGLEGDRSWSNLADRGGDIDPHQVSKDVLAEFIKSPEYVDPGVEAGIFDQTKYKYDEQGIYFEYVGKDGVEVRVRRNQFVPLPPNPQYNGGRPVEPIWFDPVVDGALFGMTQGMFESDGEYFDRMKDNAPMLETLERRQVEMTNQYHETIQRAAWEQAGGFNDVRKAIEAGGDWELVYQGKAADYVGGDAMPSRQLVGDDWGWQVQMVGNAFNHALQVLTGEEITIIKSMKDDRYREESYFTLDLPLADGRTWEAPMAQMKEFGPAVEAEVQAEIAAANRMWQRGHYDVYLESMNDQGKPITFGSMEESANFMFEMVVDFTNWVPWMTVGKRALNGARAAVAAGRVPANSVGARLAGAVSDAARAFRTHPDTFRMSGAMTRDAEKSIGMTSEEFTRFLDEDLYGLVDDINTKEGWERSVQRITEHLAKRDPNLNPQQLHQWVEDNLIHMFRQKGITVHTTPDEMVRQMEAQKAATARKSADEVELITRIEQRAKDELDAAKRVERSARKLERERATARAKDMEALKPKVVKPEAPKPEAPKPPAKPVRRGTPVAPDTRPVGDKAPLLADTVKGDVAKVAAPDARAAREANRYVNRGPTIPVVRYKRLGGGRVRRMGPADLRENIDRALSEIAEAERKLLGKPSAARKAKLEQQKVDWGSRKETLDAALVRVERVDEMVAKARRFAEREVNGVWEPRANEEGVLVQTKVRAGEFVGQDIDDVTDLFVEDALIRHGYTEGNLSDFREWAAATRKDHIAATREYYKVLDELSGGKLNPNLNIEKNLTIIREQQEIIARELAYGRLRLGLGAPEDLFGKYVPGTAGKVEQILRAEDLADALSQTALIRRASLSEAARAAENAKGFERVPYKLDAEYAKKYVPREPVGSVDEAKRAQEAAMVQRWREKYGVATFERTVTAWRSGNRIVFPSLVPPPGSQVINDSYLKSLDAVIAGPDPEAAARAWHEKAMIYEQSRNRFHALTTGEQYPNGYQSALNGAFTEPDNLGRLDAENRAYRELTTLQRMNRPTDRHYMLFSERSEEVYFGHAREVTFDRTVKTGDPDVPRRFETGNDPRGRTMEELLGEQYWFYANSRRGPGDQFGEAGRVEFARYDKRLRTRDETGEVLPSEAGAVFYVNIGDDLARATGDRMTASWYQPWQPWDAISGNPYAAALPDSTWWQLAETGRNVEFVKTMEATDVQEWVAALHAARVDGGWDNLGAHDYRRTMQPLVDMFHGLHDAVKAGDSEAFLTMERLHDVFSTMHMAGRETQHLDDYISTWLLLESRMGLPHALVPDYALWNFKRMAKSYGMMPQRASMMVQHKLKSPRFVGAYSDFNPSIHPLFDGNAGPRVGTTRLKNSEGLEMGWNAEPPEPWLATGKTKRVIKGNAYTADWQDAHHAYMAKKGMSFDQMVHAALALLRTNSAVAADWGLTRGGKLRAAVLERTVHGVAQRIRIRGGKAVIGAGEDSQVVGNMYWNYLKMEGLIPPGVIDYQPSSRLFQLDDSTGRMLKKEFASLDEIRDLFAGFGKSGQGRIPDFDDFAQRLGAHAQRHLKNDSYSIPPVQAKNPFGVSKVKSTYSKALGHKDHVEPLRAAVEVGVNGVQGYKRIPSQSPYESVMHFIANRAYWTDAVSRSQGTTRASWFMDEMERFAAKGAITADDLEMAKSMVRDILQPEFRNEVYRLNDAALTGASPGYLVRNVIGDNPKFVLMERVGYGDPKTLAEKAVADAKAGRLRMRKDVSKNPLKDADEFSEADRTAAEMRDRRERLEEKHAQDQMTWDEPDNGYLDLGTPGGLPGRLDELEGRWQRLFEGEGGRVLPDADEVYDRHMNDWLTGHGEPPKVEPRKRRRVEKEVTTRKGPLSKDAKVGDTVTLPVGEARIKRFDGDMVVVDVAGEERRFMRSQKVWESRTRTVKYEDIKGSPETEATRSEQIVAREKWEAARAAEEKRAKAIVRDLRAGKTSVEADQLVGEVVGLLKTPGHAGDGQLRLGRMAAEMARSPQLAEGLRSDIVEAFRSIAPIMDGGRAVWDDAYLGKVPDTMGGELPSLPRRPATAEERIASAGETGSPDVAGTAHDAIRADAAEQQRAYEAALADYQRGVNEELERRVVADAQKPYRDEVERVDALREDIPVPDVEPPESMLDDGDIGVRIEVDHRDGAMDVHQSAKVAWDLMGYSEERYYQRLIEANHIERLKSGTSPARVVELTAHNENLLLALRAVRRQKRKKTYKRPARKMQDAYDGAKQVQDDVEGILPDQKMGYYGDSPEAIELEHGRALRVRSERAKRTGHVQEKGLPDGVMRKFKVEHWRGLTAHVAESVRGMQPMRETALTLGHRTDPNDIVDDILRTSRDKDKRIRATVEAAITEYCKDKGIEDWGVELYWRVRTLVAGSEGKMRRGIGMLEVAGPDPGDFLNLRRAAADREAFEQVKQFLYNNSAATPEEAAEWFRLVAQTSGKIEDVQETLTQADITILDSFVSHITGVADVSDKVAMREALGKHMRPPLDQRSAMREYQERVGRWSPRTSDEVVVNGAWSMDDEIEYWALNYEDLPRWVDDKRIRTGEVFRDYDVHQAVMREVGGFDDGARLARAKSGEHNFDLKDYAHGRKKPGTDEWEIKPKKDWETQRKYAIERYGDRVAENGVFHEMPWLMTPDELIRYVGAQGHEVPGIISNPAQVRAVAAAIEEVTQNYVDKLMKVYDGTATTTVLSSADIHEMTFQLVQRLSATTPWRKGLQRASMRGGVDLWGSFWTGLVLINPAFVVSNAVDVPTKTLAFALSEKYAKKRFSRRAMDAIPDAYAVGHGERSQFFYGTGARRARDRITDPYSLTDAVGGVWDAATGGIASHVLVPIEQKSKTLLARMLYDGLYDEFGEYYLKGIKHKVFNPKGIKVTEEQLDLLLKLRVRDRLRYLFPSLEDAGLAERLLNRLLPFISYNAKNRLLWTSWVLDHPWSIRLLQEAQGQLVAHNQREWREKHGDAPMPENLAHQIQIGSTGFFVDIGMFTDGARGAEWVTSPLKGMRDADGKDWLALNGNDIMQFIRLWARPLPNQEAFAWAVLYDVTDKVTGHGFGGRYVWRRWIDPETGMWSDTGGPNGNGFVQDYVGPGTAWGDRRFDYWNNMMPFEGLRETLGNALHNQEISDDFVVRVIGNLMDFQEFGHVSESYSLYLIYNELLGPDGDQYDLAGDWLKNTADGQRLQELWMQAYWDPDNPEKPFGNELHINEYASLFYDEEGNFVTPTGKDMRKRFRDAQPPDIAGLIREANEKLFAMRDAFDQELDRLDPEDHEGRQHLWRLRRAEEGALSQEYPEVHAYYAFGETPEEAYKHRLASQVDTQRQQFYDVYGWELKPEDPKEAAAWLKRRRGYLKANPEFAATLADEYSEWQRSLNRVEKARDLAISNNESLERVRTWAQARDMQGVAEAASTLIDFNSRAFGMESAGYDENGQWRFKHDSGWRKFLRGDDPAKVWYAEAMRGVGERAVDDKGEFNVNKWWRIIDRNKDLRSEYLEREGLSGEEWRKKGRLYEFHDQWSRAAEKGQWDKAWKLYENLGEGTKEYWKEQNPKGFNERLKSYEYSNAMGRWVAYFERGDSAGAMRYFYSLPQWMRDRYYANNPGKRLSQGQSSGYIQMLDRMFDQIDAGNWDAAERIWRAAPAYMRSQYYANNPNSTLFRGSGASRSGGSYRGGGGGGGISDARFRTYIKSMKTWVNLLKDGKDAEAKAYFNGLEQWKKDFYWQNNPDKKFQMQNDKMFALAAEYFVAEPAAQRAMLRRNPGLRRWLNENDTGAARKNAIRFAYQKLPDDPWLKRVYREKYPEVFSDEAKGKAKREAVFDILEKYPEFMDEWMRWYEDIAKTMVEALAYMNPRPRQLEQDYSAMRGERTRRGLSAAEVAEQVGKSVARTPRYTVRAPRIS